MKVNILGCYINNIISYKDDHDALLALVLDNNTHYITVNNVHTVIKATGNEVYKKTLNNSFLSLSAGETLEMFIKYK